MFATSLTLAIALSTQSGTIPEVLSDTPQGRHVSAYIEAFNAGEAAFVAMYEAATVPKMAAQISPARRVELYNRLVREVGTIKVEKVIASSPKNITFSMRVPGKGSTAMFAFTFEEKAPFRISGVDMEVSQR
jgi:hypothetical protein